MDKRGIHWQEIATVMLILAVVITVIIVFNRESRAEFLQLVGIREKLTKIELPDLGLLTPGEKAKLERESPETRKALLQAMMKEADSAFDAGKYSDAVIKYNSFLDKCKELSNDCANDLKTKAEGRLEEARFRSIADLVTGQEKLSAVDNFAKDYPNSKFLAELYFIKGGIYAGDIKLFDVDKARANYNEALRLGYNGVKIDKALSKLDPKNTATMRANLLLFNENLKLARDYFNNKQYTEAYVRMTEAAVPLDADALILNEFDVNAFRLDQIKIYKVADKFEEALKIYENLKAQVTDPRVLNLAKKSIGIDYFKTVYVKEGEIAPVYGNTGIMLKSFEGEKSLVICPTYNNKQLDWACIAVGITKDYVTVPNYPFLALKSFEIERGELNIIDVKLINAIDPEKRENQFELTETSAGGADLTNRKQVLPGVDISVQYDGDELYFTVPGSNKFSDICSSKITHWDYTSSNPSDTAVVCQNLPSLSMYHVSHRPPDSSGILVTDYATVKFVYTP